MKEPIHYFFTILLGRYGLSLTGYSLLASIGVFLWLDYQRLHWIEKLSSLKKAQIFQTALKRAFARYIDYVLVFPLTLLLITSSEFIIWSNVLGSLNIFLWIPFEVFFLSKYSTTPGKWLLNMRVHNNSSSLGLSFRTSLKRAFYVWTVGMACGTLLLLFTYPLALYFYMRNGTTKWDEWAKTTYNSKSIDWKLWVVIGLIIVSYLHPMFWEHPLGTNFLVYFVFILGGLVIGTISFYVSKMSPDLG